MPDLSEIECHVIFTFDPLAPDHQLKHAIAVLQEHVVNSGRLFGYRVVESGRFRERSSLSARIVVRLWR